MLKELARLFYSTSSNTEDENISPSSRKAELRRRFDNMTTSELDSYISGSYMDSSYIQYSREYKIELLVNRNLN